RGNCLDNSPMERVFRSLKSEWLPVGGYMDVHHAVRVMVQDLLTESLEKRFGNALMVPHPVEWLTDNGSCYIADATRAFASSLGFIVCTTPVRSPESNGMAESFVKTFKRDYVYVNDLLDAVSVMEKMAEWMEDYNNLHPHKGLNMKSPREYRDAMLAVN
ncbi:integrase core domain-containing protein, partial [Yersinia similis]